MSKRIGRDTAAARDPQGKVALFSGAVRPGGAFVVECSGCGSRTPVGVVDLAKLVFPVHVTIPFRYHHTWMLCPACHNRRWVRIRRGVRGE